MVGIRTNLAEFLEQLKGFDEKVNLKGVRKMRDMATFANTQLVDYTPYLTGRLKASWRVGINAADPSNSSKGQRTLGQARSEGLSTVGRIATAKLGDNVILSNSVEYARFVEDGGPNNTPRRMIARTLSDIIARYGRG